MSASYARVTPPREYRPKLSVASQKSLIPVRTSKVGVLSPKPCNTPKRRPVRSPVASRVAVRRSNPNPLTKSSTTPSSRLGIYPDVSPKNSVVNRSSISTKTQGSRGGMSTASTASRISSKSSCGQERKGARLAASPKPR
jgi:hypothetical protein